MFQEKDPNVEAVADDLASIFLDIEMEEKGFARSGLNPFVFLQKKCNFYFLDKQSAVKIDRTFAF